MEDLSCARAGCGHSFRLHAPRDVGRGRCAETGCCCVAFYWVPLDGPAVGSYREPPARSS